MTTKVQKCLQNWWFQYLKKVSIHFDFRARIFLQISKLSTSPPTTWQWKSIQYVSWDTKSKSIGSSEGSTHSPERTQYDTLQGGAQHGSSGGDSTSQPWETQKWLHEELDKVEYTDCNQHKYNIFSHPGWKDHYTGMNAISSIMN